MWVLKISKEFEENCFFSEEFLNFLLLYVHTYMYSVVNIIHIYIFLYVYNNIIQIIQLCSDIQGATNMYMYMWGIAYRVSKRFIKVKICEEKSCSQRSFYSMTVSNENNYKIKRFSEQNEKIHFVKSFTIKFFSYMIIRSDPKNFHFQQ